MSSKEAATVVYEGLVEGSYKFLLQIWTNTKEFSQDAVVVQVHNNEKSLILKEVYKNLVKIELNYNVLEFTQGIKDNFIAQLQIIVQQSHLKFKNPKVIIFNTRVSSRNKKNYVILEIFAIQDIDEDIGIISRQTFFNVKSYIDLSQDVIEERVENTKKTLIKSEDIVKLLKPNSSWKFINPVLAFINKPQTSTEQLKNPMKFSNMNNLNVIHASLMGCNSLNSTS